MIKKIFYITFALFMLFLSIPTISASRSIDSNKIENKTPFNYKGKTLYASVEINFNINNQGFTNDAKIIKNISAKYDDVSDVFYLSVKRSEINKLFSTKYDNVYSLLQANIDYHGALKEGGYFLQLNHDAADCGYTLTKNESDFNYRNYGYLEVFSSTAPLSGTIGGEPIIGGGITIVDSLSKVNQKSEYCRADFENLNPVIDLKKTKMSINIVEDEKINLGENKNVISANSDFGNSNSEKESLISEDINSFYAEYDEKNKLKYSWTLFDENGNPIDINYDTQIDLDSSEYEDQIENLFDYNNKNIKDKIKFISFKHEGKLNGTAKVSIYVGDKFKTGEKLNLFYYNKNSKTLEKVNVTKDDENYYIIVDDEGYATFEIDHCSEYVLADSVLNIKSVKKINEAKKNINVLNPFIIAALSLIAITLTIIIIFYIKKNKYKHTI